MPIDFALKVMRDPAEPAERRDRMCMALLPYLHKRVADSRPSIKEAKRQAAAAASKSRFAPSAPPKLSVVGGE